VYRFDEDRRLESEERNSGSPESVGIEYRRNPISGAATGVTVRCYDLRRQVLRQADGEDGREDAVDALVARTCGLT